MHCVHVIEIKQCSGNSSAFSRRQWWLYYSSLCRKGRQKVLALLVCIQKYLFVELTVLVDFFKVTYDVNGFCERNRDVLFKDLIELMQTSEKLVLFLSMLLTLQLIDVCMNLILICHSYNWIKPCCLFLLTALSSVICSPKMLTLKKEVDPQQQETKLRSAKQSPTPPC